MKTLNKYQRSQILQSARINLIEIEGEETVAVKTDLEYLGNS